MVLYGGEIGMEDISDKINYARGPMQWDDTNNAGKYLFKYTNIAYYAYYLLICYNIVTILIIN